MAQNEFEVLRVSYKPNPVRILFIGESRPAQGTFFYCGDSNLYRYTKEAFETATRRYFDLTFFKAKNCWLYDVCDIPVNKDLTPAQRKQIIRQNLPNLVNTVKEINPEYIIVVKMGELRDEVKPKLYDLGYIDGTNTFYLPFPSTGRQKEYRDQLTKVLKSINI